MNQKKQLANNNKRNPPFSRFKCIPKRWLSSENHGDLIQCESMPNLFFIPMKTPLTDFLSQFLNQPEPWTPTNALKQIKAMIPAGYNPNFLAINVSLSSQIISKAYWQALGVQYARCPIPKDYQKNYIDTFCDIINKELTRISNQTLVCLVYSGCGHNRVGFSITGYLSRNCQELNLEDAYRKVNAASPNCIYLQKPLDTLSTAFKTSAPIHGEPPKGIRYPDDVHQIQAVDLELPMEKYAGLKKVSKPRTPDSNLPRDEILGILADAFEDESILRDNAFPLFSPTIWNSESMDQLRSRTHYIAIEPRGLKSYVVINKENRVFLVVPIIPNNITSTYSEQTVRPRNDVYELRAQSKVTSLPAVASAYLIEEKKRTVIFTTDLLLLNNARTYGMTLQTRLSHLYHQFTTKLRPDSDYFNNMNNNNPRNMNEQNQNQMMNQNSLQNYQIHFVYRPVSRVTNFAKLIKDLNTKFFVKSDGISFIDDEAPPLTSLLLPIQPSVVFLFDYNGSNKSILYSLNDSQELSYDDPIKREFPLEPFSVFVPKNSKYNGMDGRTNRFTFDKEKRLWKPLSVGFNDPPTTTTAINEIVNFIDSNFRVDDAFIDEIIKIGTNY